MGNSTTDVPRPRIQLVSQRRSQRLAVSIPIQVSGKKATGEAFSEDTSTLIVNAHGGLIAMKEPVAGGQIVKLRNMTSEDAIDCTVVDVEVGEDGSPEIGIEFVEPNAKFWHISFPPSDWSPRSPEAKRFSMPISSGNVDPSKK